MREEHADGRKQNSKKLICKDSFLFYYLTFDEHSAHYPHELDGQLFFP